MTGSTFPSQVPNDRPTSTVLIASTNTNTPDQPSSIPTSEVGTDIMSSVHPSSTYTPERPSTPVEDRYTPVGPSYTGTAPSSSGYPSSTIDTTRYPTVSTITTANRDKYPPVNGYGSTDPYSSDQRPTNPTYGGQSKPDYPQNTLSYPPNNPNKYNYYQDVYPLYAYPMQYESNYPMPNNGMDARYPVYGQNVQPVDGSHRPSPLEGNHRPPPVDGSQRPPPPPSNGYYGSTTATSSNGPNGASTYMGNGYSNADEVNRYKPNTVTPSDNNYNSNKPPTFYGTKPNSTSTKPNNSINNYGQTSMEGKYEVTEATIETYFNPDDYNRKRE